MIRSFGTQKNETIHNIINIHKGTLGNKNEIKKEEREDHSRVQLRHQEEDFS